MTRTLGSLVDERATVFVGREPERSALLELLGDDGPVLAFVCGLAGIGKSSLLAAFADEARASGAAVVAVDGEVTEPTPGGFLRQISAALGREVTTVETAADAIGALRDRVILTVDVHERLRLLDDWLRRVLVPALPAHARVVIVGRDAPVAAWVASFGPLLRVIELDTLGTPDAVELLRRLGVPPVRAVPINRVLRGHPLSLRLVAATPSTLAGGDDAALRPATEELARVYLAELEPATRRALDAASVVRRVTVPLLDAMLGDGEAADAFARVRALPFVSAGSDGLVVHHVMREAVSGALRAADSPAHRRLRTAAWRQLRRELDEAPEADLWRYTADMLYLLESPAVRDAFFPTTAQLYAVEPAAPDDGPAIGAIAQRHEPGAGAELQRAWWDAAPEAFYVARDADGGVAGYSAVCEPTALPARLIDRDPIASAWREHGRSAPLRRGERSLFIRFMCGAESGEQPAPDVSALYLDLKRTYLTMRPALRRIYTCAHNLEAMGATLEPLGFAPIGEVDLGARRYAVYCNELGPASIDGWLADLAARDVLGHSATVLHPDERALTLDGDRIALSPLEFGVLACLHEHEGRVVRRETLLRDVWRSEWDGDGNALESVVSALRRKLGPRAKALETVRGVGYRLRPLG